MGGIVVGVDGSVHAVDAAVRHRGVPMPPRSSSPLGRTGDLLVVGARGRGGFRHLLTGSITTQLVNHAPCLVTVVPSRRAEARG
jgi:hypothetical protein